MNAVLPAAETTARSRTPSTAEGGASTMTSPSHAIDAQRPEALQRSWAALPVRRRLSVLRLARHALAQNPMALADAISPALARNRADTLACEVLPLLDACRFLEREAEALLKPRKLGRRGRPLWLTGVYAEVRREALGHVLVIGPANFPLFLPGVQVLQALAAGNRVTWKPGAGGRAVALQVRHALVAAGLPEALLQVTGDSVEAARQALATGADKVIFTGSAEAGHAVLSTLANTGTPAVVELSGADAVLVLPGADLQRVAKALAFGLRLNGGAVCMSPRRVLSDAQTLARLTPLLQQELATVPPVALPDRISQQLQELVAEAVEQGATLHSEFSPQAQRPLLLAGASAAMRVTQSDIFAPVVSLLCVQSAGEMVATYARCPFALTAAIFHGARERREAEQLASRLRAGTVLLNDLIAPTADPRVPFGGRAGSGFGTTRGAEGLLEMTAAKAVLARRGGSVRHLVPTTENDAPALAAITQLTHGGDLRLRFHAIRELMRLGRRSSASANTSAQNAAHVAANSTASTHSQETPCR